MNKNNMSLFIFRAMMLGIAGLISSGAVNAQSGALGWPQTLPSPATEALHNKKRELVQELDQPYTGNSDVDYANVALLLYRSLAEIAKVQALHGNNDALKEWSASSLKDAQNRIEHLESVLKNAGHPVPRKVPAAQPQGYAAQVRACVESGLEYKTPPRRGSSNPTVQFRAELTPFGAVHNVTVQRSSGLPAFDEAVLRAVKACSPFPRPPSGSYPRSVDGVFRMYG